VALPVVLAGMIVSPLRWVPPAPKRSTSFIAAAEARSSRAATRRAATQHASELLWGEAGAVAPVEDALSAKTALTACLTAFMNWMPTVLQGHLAVPESREESEHLRAAAWWHLLD
jgi:hypothetical protein